MNKYREALKKICNKMLCGGECCVGEGVCSLLEPIQELIDNEKTPTIEEVKKEWEEAGYELINDYCSDFHFVKKIENTIYNRPIYHHFVIEKINGGRYIPYSSFEKENNNFNNRQYFIISLQEHQLLTKIFKALEWL